MTEATDFLNQFDARQVAYSREKADSLTPGLASTEFVDLLDVENYSGLQAAVRILTCQAALERDDPSLSTGWWLLVSS